MKLAAYLRVSTDRQAEEGLGLDVQERAIRSWARQHQHRVAAVHRDEGRSGSAELVDRPGLADAIADVRAKRASAIIVYRVDRLARDLVLQELLIGEVRRAGGVVRSTSPAEDHYLTDDPDDPTRALVRQVLGAVAQYERAMIRLRMGAGKRRKAERGGYAGGRPPYGWQAIGRELVPDVDEQATLARMAKRRRQRASYREIAAELNDDAGATTRAGRPWSPMAVSRALRHAEGGPRTTPG